MSGPRFSGWHHKQGAGQSGEDAYRPEAAKLLGAVVQEAARNGLQTHQMQRRYPDGTVIIAELIGGIPRTTIIPAGGKPVKPRRFKTQMLVLECADSPTIPARVHRFDLGVYEVQGDRTIVKISTEIKFVDVLTLTGVPNARHLETNYRGEWANRFRNLSREFFVGRGWGWGNDGGGLHRFSIDGTALVNRVEGDSTSDFSEPEDLFANPARKQIYVYRQLADSFSVHDAGTLDMIGMPSGSPSALGPNAFNEALHLRVHPSGRWIYVPLSCNLFDQYSGQGVAVISTDTLATVAHFEVAPAPAPSYGASSGSIEISWDGRELWCFNAAERDLGGGFSVLDSRVQRFSIDYTAGASAPTHTLIWSQDYPGDQDSFYTPRTTGMLDPRHRALHGGVYDYDTETETFGIEPILEAGLDPMVPYHASLQNRHRREHEFSPDGNILYTLSQPRVGNPDTATYIVASNSLTGAEIQAFPIADLEYETHRARIIASPLENDTV